MLLILVLFTVILGIYPAIILDGLHYATYCLLFTFDSNSLDYDMSYVVNLEVTTVLPPATTRFAN